MMKAGFKRWLCATCSVSVFTSMPALAQDPGPNPPVETQGSDIVVTATQRRENIQDVPIAVSNFSAEQLERSGVRDLRELQGLAPSLNVGVTSSDATGANVRIRNVGTEAINPGLESTVGIVVDGIPRSRASVGLADIPGLERIEVLRGPQGTLFGKNTSAGIVHIITAAPSFTPGAFASASFGNLNSQEYIVGVTSPIGGDHVAARIDGAYFRRDGHVIDPVNDRLYRDKDRFALRGQLLFRLIDDDLTLRIIADASRVDEAGADVGVYRRVEPSLLALAAAVGAPAPYIGFEPYSVTLSRARQPRLEIEQWGISGQLNWSFGFGQLTAITGYRDWSSQQARDIDVGSIDIAYIPPGGARQAFHTFSQEIRLQGTAGILDWLVGGFYGHERLGVRNGFRFGADWVPFFNAQLEPSLPAFQALGACGFAGTTFFQRCTGLSGSAAAPEGAGVGTEQFDQTARSFALFTHNSIRLADWLTLTAGLRYTRETKSLDATIANTLNPGCSALSESPALQNALPIICLQNFDPRFDGTYFDRRREHELTGTGSVSFHLAPDINAYGSYSRGYKAGGYNLDRAGFFQRSFDPKQNPSDAAQLHFEPELVDAFEAGLKTQFFDRALTVNIAAFHSTFTGYQLSFNSGQSVLTVNIPEVTTKGVEVEATATTLQRLRVGGGVTYAEARFGTIPADFLSTLLFPLPASSQTRLLGLSGQRLSNAPLWTVTGSIGYDDMIGSRLKWFAYADGRYQSSVASERLLNPLAPQEAYVLANVRLGLGSVDEHWQLELWGRNIADKHYCNGSIGTTLNPAGNLTCFPGDPRTYGLTLRTRW